MTPKSSTGLQALRDALSRWVFSPLQGVTFRDWWRLVAREGHRIPPRYWARAASTGIGSVVNSIQARREQRRFGARIEATEVTAPVFILGHYRGGTTHLHNLLSMDSRFGFCTYYQANFPRTFLLTEGFGARMEVFAPRKRPQDNVALGLAVPAEDELALCADTLLSPHMCWHFPARTDRYRRYLAFEDVDAAEKARWKASLGRFARKLSFRYDGRTLVLKSPCHTARVSTILKVFPDARFIHIHRDPLTVYQSTRYMELKVAPLFQYQKRELDRLDDFILWRYRRMYDAYLDERRLVPEGRLVECSYDDLERNPVATLKGIYRGLDLPDYDSAAPEIETYLGRINGYRKNAYGALDPAIRGRVAHEWARSFDEWGYPRPS